MTQDIRYLTTICDQVMALISPEHARSVVWSGQEGEDTMEMDENQDEYDRMFTFEVRKTNEQEEAIKPRPGFKVCPIYCNCSVLTATRRLRPVT